MEAEFAYFFFIKRDFLHPNMPKRRPKNVPHSPARRERERERERERGKTMTDRQTVTEKDRHNVFYVSVDVGPDSLRVVKAIRAPLY